MSENDSCRDFLSAVEMHNIIVQRNTCIDTDRCDAERNSCWGRFVVDPK